MNIVFKKGSPVPLKPGELAEEANAITQNKPFTVFDFMGPKSRIAGSGHCACGGHGEFELLPVSHPDVRSGQKRYMFCRKCGGYSHL